ncbi:MAG: PH domain-containing protein [Nitrososphaeria archaeon]
MSAASDQRIGADPSLSTLYYLYLAIPVVPIAVVLLVVSIVMLPYAVRPGIVVALTITWVLFPVIVVPVALWIERYRRSIHFTLESTRIIFERGVWWKRRSFVPYNRITNVDVVQGPLSRMLGLGKVTIQTAGYSATSRSSGTFAEAAIFGVKNFEKLKDTVLERVSRMRPVAVEAGAEMVEAGEVGQQILEELRRIRKTLESKE